MGYKPKRLSVDIYVRYVEIDIYWHHCGVDNLSSDESVDKVQTQSNR